MFIKDIKTRFRVILSSGVGNITLFILLSITILLLIISMFYDITSNHKFVAIIGVVQISFLGELLYRNLKMSKDSQDLKTIEESGIYMCSNSLHKEKACKILDTSGEIIILNTWIYNYTNIKEYILNAVRSKNATLNFYLLDPRTCHAQIRSYEVGRDVPHEIFASLSNIYGFLAELDDKEKSRVNVFLLDFSPKFTIYGTKFKAVVGFYPPKRMATDMTQFFIQGETGYFSSLIWEYYDHIKESKDHGFVENITDFLKNLTSSFEIEQEFKKKYPKRTLTISCTKSHKNGQVCQYQTCEFHRLNT